MPYAAPLGSASFYTPSLTAFSRATSNLADSTIRLSSGSRFAHASDDVASLSIASRLQSQVVAIKSAQGNTSQGTSFLQVANDALSQIRDIVGRMNALAVQANSSSLVATDRALLQEEFSQLSDEIDRIAENTSFGDIKLLDGTVSGENNATTSTTAATQASGTITLTGIPTAGQTVIVNGVSFVAAVAAATETEFTIGGDTTITATNLKNALNASTDRRISQATYSSAGATVTITQDAGGKLGNQFTINQASSTASFNTAGGATQVANFYTLQGGLDNGLRTNSVKAHGTIGDALVNTQSQVQGSVTLTLSGAVSDGETLSIDNGNGGTQAFTFRNAPTLSTEIQIGSDTTGTLQGIIETLTQYSASNNFGTRQLEFERSGDQLTIRNKTVGNPTDFTATTLDIAEGITNGALSGTSFTNGATTGVNVSGVVNADFIGTIDGFTATYVGADSITASVTVGSKTYTAAITDTTPGSNTIYRFNSTSGGYFDVQLATGGHAVTNQPTANDYASYLNAAFSTLSFTQSRAISSFSGVNGLVAGSAELTGDNFTNVQIKSINVTAPSVVGGDATIEFNIDGEIYRSAGGLKSSLGKYETITLTSITDGTKSLKITNGATTNSFANGTTAATFEATLRASFGLNEDGAGIDFQVGPDAADKINVVVGDARTEKLFSGITPDIGTQDGAEDAQDTLSAAADRLDEIIAQVGSLQQRFDIAGSNLENLKSGIDTARANLADTDIAEESTKLAVETLKANAGAAVIAQISQLQASLLGTLKIAA